MDAFFANVELLGNPDLAGKAFGVSPHIVFMYTCFESPLKVGKGVLCTASYEARKHGVRSGMAGIYIGEPVLLFH